MVPAKCKYAGSESSACLRGIWLKTEVPDHNIGVPPLRKYANHRTLCECIILLMFLSKNTQEFFAVYPHLYLS